MNEESGAWAMEATDMDKNHNFADTKLCKCTGVTGLPCVSGSHQQEGGSSVHSTVPWRG